MNTKTAQIKNTLVNILSKYALPLLLGAVVMNIIFKTYLVDNVRLYTFGYVVYECLLFALFEWLKPKKVLRGLVYTALMVAVLFLGFQLLRAGFEHSGKSFINWFYVNRQEIGQIDEYFYFRCFIISPLCAIEALERCSLCFFRFLFTESEPTQWILLT